MTMVTKEMVERAAIAIEALWSDEHDRGPAFEETERSYQDHCRATARAALEVASPTPPPTDGEGDLVARLADWFNNQIPDGGLGKEHFDALVAIVQPLSRQLEEAREALTDLIGKTRSFELADEEMRRADNAGTQPRMQKAGNRLYSAIQRLLASARRAKETVSHG